MAFVQRGMQGSGGEGIADCISCSVGRERKGEETGSSQQNGGRLEGLNQSRALGEGLDVGLY